MADRRRSRIVGNCVTAVLNGKKVHDNARIEGITGGALDAKETEPGPIMIQGDHEKVWFRKVTVTPITSRRLDEVSPVPSRRARADCVRAHAAISGV